MKHFVITYRLKAGLEDRRRREIVAFIAAVDADPDLRGKISYTCMKEKGGNAYYHLVSAYDEVAVGTLQSRELFDSYTAETDAAAEGEVEVTPLEIIAETATAFATAG